MKNVVLERNDFQLVQDGSGDSFFDELLESLGVPIDGREDINTVDLTVDSYETA